MPVMPNENISPLGNLSPDSDIKPWTYEHVCSQLADLGVFLNSDGSMYIRQESILAGYVVENNAGERFQFVPPSPLSAKRGNKS